MCIGHIKETLTGFLQFERNRASLFDNKSQRLERGKYLNQGTLSDQGRNHYWKVHRREFVSESKSTNCTLNGNEKSQLEGFGAPLLTVRMEKATCKGWNMATRSWEWPGPTANQEMGVLVPWLQRTQSCQGQQWAWKRTLSSGGKHSQQTPRFQPWIPWTRLRLPGLPICTETEITSECCLKFPLCGH